MPIPTFAPHEMLEETLTEREPLASTGSSAELQADLEQLQHLAQQQRDREREAELARQRELARYD